MTPWAEMDGALGTCVVLEGASLICSKRQFSCHLTRIRKDEPMQLLDLNEEACWLKMQPAARKDNY